MIRTRTLNHDPRFCDICDSEDVAPQREPATGNGWYGGTEILWATHGTTYGPLAVQVLCRQHKAEHDAAETNAARYQVVVDDQPETVYFCPAHQAEHSGRFGTFRTETQHQR